MSAAAFTWMRGSGGRRSSPGAGAGRETAEDGATRASSLAACPLNRRIMRNTTRYTTMPTTVRPAVNTTSGRSLTSRVS